MSDNVTEIVESASPAEETVQQAVDRLASLPPLDYETQRDEVAKIFAVRKSVLDAEVAKLRPPEASEDSESCITQDVEPWESPVNGQTLFEEIRDTISKYLALQQYQAEAVALWSIFSYCIDANNIAPKLLIHSPEKRCGKTTLLDVLGGLVWKPLPASNITPAAIFRTIEAIGGTIIIDEADTFINETPEITGIINSGHRKSNAFVIRLVGDSHEPKQFSTWAPNIIAMIGKPKDTIVDRSIIIEMRRKRSNDSVQRFVPHKAEKHLHTLARQIRRWSDDNFGALKGADPLTPESLNDRAADNWRPLLAIADLIGPECAKIARAAAFFLNHKECDEEDETPGIELLKDVLEVFKAEKTRSKISSDDLLEKLHAMEDRPWAEWNRGNPIKARQVAVKLKPFGARPKTIRFHDKTKKGYWFHSFLDAFSRYIPGLSVTTSQVTEINTCSYQTTCNIQEDVTDEFPPEGAEKADCYDVTDETEIVWG